MATSADICSFFFEPVFDAGAPPPAPASPPPAPPCSEPPPKKKARKMRPSLGGASRHRCRVCHNVYAQAASTGYTNLLTHLRIKHPNWEELFRLQRLDVTNVAVASSSETPVTAKREAVQQTATFSPSVATATSDTKPRRTAGRKRGPVYAHFEDVLSSPGNQQKRMRCLYCHEDAPQISGRLKLHLSSKCPGVPQDVKEKYAGAGILISNKNENGAKSENVTKVENVAKVESVATVKNVPTVESVAPMESSLHKSIVVATTDKTTLKSPITNVVSPPALRTPLPVYIPMQTASEPSDLRRFEDKITTALVATKAPWSLLDNIAFREAMEILRAASNEFPLTSARARSEVLDRLVQEYDRECHEVLATSNTITLAVSSAGVGDSDMEKTTYIVLDEWRREFVLAESRNCSVSPYTADVLSVVSALPPRSPSTKLFLCTPSSGVYAQSRQELLQSASASGNVFSLMGVCMVQQTGLLLHELVNSSLSLEEAIDNAVLTADALRVVPSLRHRIAQDAYSWKDTGNVQRANAFAQVSMTSWRSIAMAVQQATRLESFLRPAIPRMKQTDTSSPILRELLDLGSSSMAWNALRGTAQLLTPLHFISVLSELQTVSSGQLLALWIWLFGAAARSSLFDGNSDALIRNFMRRLECYVEEHFVACLVLDPRVHGAGLSVSGLRRARGVAVRVATALAPGFNENNFIRSYNDYMKQQGDFGEPGVWNTANTSSPMEFWGDYEGDPIHSQLALVAKTICSFVPHTSSVDELWADLTRRNSTGGVSAEALKQHEKCAKVRHSTLVNARFNVKETIRRFGTLLDMKNELSVEEILQSNATLPEIDDQVTSARNLSVRAVLESIPDGLEEDMAAVNSPSTPLDASWFDISSAGLDKIRKSMENYLSAAIQQ